MNCVCSYKCRVLLTQMISKDRGLKKICPPFSNFLSSCPFSTFLTRTGCPLKALFFFRKPVLIFRYHLNTMSGRTGQQQPGGDDSPVGHSSRRGPGSTPPPHHHHHTESLSRNTYATNSTSLRLINNTHTYTFFSDPALVHSR